MEFYKDGAKFGSGSSIDVNESTGIDIVATGDGHEGDFAISVEETSIRYTTVTLSNSDIKNLAATQKELVAAQGAGKMIEFISATFKLNYGSEVLTESADNMVIKYVDDSGVAASGTIEATGFIDASADAITTVPAIAVVNATSAQVENTALVLDNTGDGEYGGNASNDTTITVGIAYRVHTL